MIVSVEGNIGVGKSRFLELVREHFGNAVKIIYEPVEQWQNCGGHNLLELFYENGPKHAYVFQTYLLSTRLQLQIEQCQTGVSLVERSGRSDVSFAKLSHENGFLSDVEYAAYMSLYNTMMALMPPTSKIIYLRASPETCMSRIYQRGRAEEAGISLAYLTRIHQLHDEWLVGPDVLVVDREVNWEDRDDIEAVMDGVRAFLNS